MQLKSFQYIARPPIQLHHPKMNDNKFTRETFYLVLCRSGILFLYVTACSRVLLSIICILREKSEHAFDGPMTKDQKPAADLLEAFAVLCTDC